MQINLMEMREQLQSKVNAIDLILGDRRNGHSYGIKGKGGTARRGWSEAAKMRLSAIARKRWKVAKRAGRNAL